MPSSCGCRSAPTSTSCCRGGGATARRAEAGWQVLPPPRGPGQAVPSVSPRLGGGEGAASGPVPPEGAGGRAGGGMDGPWTPPPRPEEQGGGEARPSFGALDPHGVSLFPPSPPPSLFPCMREAFRKMSRWEKEGLLKFLARSVWDGACWCPWWQGLPGAEEPAGDVRPGGPGASSHPWGGR